MSEDINIFLKDGKDIMNKAIQHLHDELLKVRAGKANPAILSGLMVDYYGNPTPINQVSSITTPDSRTLSIQPWEKKLLSVIEQSIFAANLGLTPMNDGEFIRINIPPLTEERRIHLVKQCKSMGEEAKVSLRNTRHKLIHFIRNEVKDGYPEDLGKRRESEIQEWLTDFYKKVEALIEAKEKDIMKV